MTKNRFFYYFEHNFFIENRCFLPFNMKSENSQLCLNLIIKLNYDLGMKMEPLKELSNSLKIEDLGVPLKL